MKELDFAFIHRVYRTTGWVWALAMFLSLGFPRPVPILIGLTIGTTVSLLLLRTLEWSVLKATAPGAPRAKRFLALLQGVKYILVGILFYFLLKSSLVNVPALAVGLSLTWQVIVLKVLGMVWQEKLKRTED